ncbi:MAG: hypothetical protein IKX85_05810 [Clostridia bacterium]|nr:hypothetical protein [Clostridia bacterium]
MAFRRRRQRSEKLSQERKAAYRFLLRPFRRERRSRLSIGGGRGTENFLRNALAELDPVSREILTRHFGRSQPLSAIAKEMSLHPEAVKSRLRRARKRLKQILEQGGMDHET